MVNVTGKDLDLNKFNISCHLGYCIIIEVSLIAHLKDNKIFPIIGNKVHKDKNAID
jgi:hypothetical protein